MKKRLINLTIAIIFIITLTVHVKSLSNVDYVLRISGSTRYETSINIGNYILKENNIGQFDSVYLASGTNFCDALTGTYLASKNNAPLLLVNDFSKDIVISYIHDKLNIGGNIYVLGGENAIPNTIYEDLDSYKITRLWGYDRYETNIKILTESNECYKNLFICTGTDFADALSVSSVGFPIMLVNNLSGCLTDMQKQYLSTLSNCTFHIVGGEQAINSTIEEQLSQYGNITRISGATRYETTVKIAENYFDNPTGVALVYALNFPDGLCVGSLAKIKNFPVLLVDDNCFTLAEEYVEREKITNGFVIGGQKVISDKTVEEIFDEVQIEKNIYQINYVLNNGENNANNPFNYIEGSTVKLEEPSRENYIFKGWYLDKNYKNKITEITPEISGDITLYAKWNLAPLNIPGEGTDDMIWSWWYYPQVISTDDSVYWGYATSEGYCGIAEYNFDTNITKKTHLKRLSKVDDHNGMALEIMDDGKILCVYAGGHNNNNEIHIRISNDSFDISQFDTHVVVESSGKTCYSQIIKYNGKYFVFYRVNNNSWAYICSDDGVEWSEEVILISSNMQYYCKFVETTQDGLVRVCMYSNPTANDPTIRMGFFDLNRLVLYNSDGSTELGNKKISYARFDPLISPVSGKTQRLFDVAISDPQDIKILYTTFTNNKKINDSIYYLYQNGQIYKICDGGLPLWNPKYQGGASFINENQIILARNENDTDYIELYKFENDNVFMTDLIWNEKIEVEGIRNARPIVDINGKFVLWHRGYYNSNTYTDFLTEAKLHYLK